METTEILSPERPTFRFQASNALDADDSTPGLYVRNDFDAAKILPPPHLSRGKSVCKACKSQQIKDLTIFAFEKVFYMALTKTQKSLLDGLKAFGVHQEQIVPMMVFLKDDEDGMWELMDYMANELPTAHEIIKKSIEIVKKRE